MITTKNLGSASGIQQQAVADRTESDAGLISDSVVIVGKFLRGRTDKPFRVTRDNYKTMLGRDPNSPSYKIVEDVFQEGVDEVSVFRVGSSRVSTDSNENCKATAVNLSGIDTSVLSGIERFSMYVNIEFKGVQYQTDYTWKRTSDLLSEIESYGEEETVNELFMTVFSNFGMSHPDTAPDVHSRLNTYMALGLSQSLTGLDADNVSAYLDALPNEYFEKGEIMESDASIRFTNVPESILREKDDSTSTAVNMLDLINGGQDIVIHSCVKVSVEPL